MKDAARATASLGSVCPFTHSSRGDPPFTRRYFSSFRPLFPLLPLALLLALTAFTVSASSLSEIPAASDAPTTSACDPITINAVWSTGVYTAHNCSIHIPTGVTLTLQAGATVKLGGSCGGYAGGCGIRVDGTLIAQGSQAQPVIFTSLADDSAAGDTNGNGPSNGAPGDWYGLYLAPGSRAALDHTSFRYGGDDYAFNGALYGWSRSQIDVQDAELSLTHSEVISGAANGIYLDGAGLTPVIQNVWVADHTNPADKYSLDYALYQSTINMQPTYSNLSFSGNSRNEVTVGSFSDPMTEDVTLGGTNYGFTCGYTLCQLTVPNGKTLTVQPDTLLDFGPSFGIAIADGGSLIAQGTQAQPVTFTSTRAAAGAPNQHWMGLWAQPGSQLRLDHCDISYASDGNYGMGGLEIETNDAQVKNCHIHHNAGDGVYLHSLAASTIHPEFTDVAVTDNGRTGLNLQAGHASSLSITWEGGSISHNGWSGVADYTWNSSIYPTLRNLIISGNGGQGDFPERRRGIDFRHHSVHPVLENVGLTSNAGEAMGWYCNGSITAKELAATGNGVDELLIPGCSVGGGQQWNLADAGIPVRVNGSIEVAPNGLLSLTPGTTLAFDKNIYGSPTYLAVRDQAALYALGTADRPIVFTGATAETGWWSGIEAVDRATITLSHCEIAYGGATSSSNLSAGLEIRWGLSGGAPTANIQNCRIHHSGRRGVQFDFANFQNTTPPVFHYNSIHDTGQEAVVNYNAPTLDARQNWWGDASGPLHPTQNPTGLGDNVGDNIVFYPWLAAPPTGQDSAGEMLVTTGAPTRVSPGQSTSYSIQYLNQMTTTVQNGVLVVQLPRSAEYVESSGGGIYWPERDQLFWKLGDIPPGGQGYLSFVLRFAWGLPQDYADSSITLFSGDNYRPDEFDRQPYLDFQPGAVSGVVLMSAGAYQSHLAASPALQAAYDAALAAGYSFHSAATVSRSEGESVLEGVLVKAAQREARILSLESGNLLVYTITSGAVTVEESGGGLRIDLLTGEKSAWGTWAEESLIGVTAQAGCTTDACKRNCRWTIIGWEYIKKKAGRIVAWTVLAPFTSGGSVAGAVWEVGSTVKKLYDCDLDCRANPSQYCCTAGQLRWSGSGLWSRLTNSCYKEKCNATTGMWVPDGYKTCIAFGQRCVAGIRANGCVDCDERAAGRQGETRTVTVTDGPSSAGEESACSAAGAAGKPRCRELELFLAKDPNAIYGPAGDLLPGQEVSYTVTYENEGLGRAYGVYVVNVLPAAFDDGTLNLYGKGVYLPGSREIFWSIGELGPKGAVDAEGAITYTVALTGGLASGTVVSNQAVVYFPSVPEETPTNSWVNTVSPLVALPQQVETGYMTPLPITLTGKKVGALPLTFEVVEQPHGGTLSDTAPNLTYTPAANFTGPDSFSFRVSNSTSTSRAAQVQIEVTPAGDTTPPTLLWTSPVSGTKNVIASASPVFTDTDGPVYTPLVHIGVSEALQETTVTSATVTLSDSSQAILLIAVRFDGTANQIVVTPRQALAEGTTYTLHISSGVTDAAGNPLAGPVTIRFTTATDTHSLYLPTIVR